MKKLFLITSFVLTLANSFAQERPSAGEATESDTINSLHAGSRALQFYLVNQIALGYKFHISASSALQVRFDVSAHLSNIFEDTKYVLKANDSTTHTSPLTVRDNSGNVQITLGYLLFVNPNDAFTVFLGLGPLFSYGRGIIERTYSDNSWNYTQTTYDFSVGINGTAGFEFAVLKDIRLTGLYDLSASYGESKIRNDDSRATEVRLESRINRLVQLNSLRLGIVLYF